MKFVLLFPRFLWLVRNYHVFLRFAKALHFIHIIFKTFMHLYIHGCKIVHIHDIIDILYFSLVNSVQFL
jgi:hypothetical protein